MGVVFSAHDSRLKRTVALKILSPEAASQAEILQRFRVEAESAARLDHEGIARVFDVGEDQGYHYLAFEFVEGQNLRDLVTTQGPLDWEQALDLTFQIAKALEHASQRGVVHRDIKPSNVLVTPAGRAKLVDMGLARLGALEQGEELTNSGATLGTFDYISPEQAEDPRHADVRSDIYSLGCTLHFMLCGAPVFPDGTMLQKLLRHQGTAPTDVRELNPNVPDDLAKVLQRMLAKKPRSRQQSARELLIELAKVADSHGVRISDSSGEYRVALPRWLEITKQHAYWLAPTAALFLCVVLLDVFWSRTNESDVRPYSLLDSPPPVEAAPNPQQEKDRPATADQPQSADADGGSAANSDAPHQELTNNQSGPFFNPDGTSWSPLDPPFSPPDPNDNSGLAQSGDDAGNHPADDGDDAATPENRGAGSGIVSQQPPNDLPPGEDILSPSPRTSSNGLAQGSNAGNVDPSRDRPNNPSGPRQLIVNPMKPAAGQYTSLKSALANARSGDIIELQFSGRLLEPEPIRLPAANLTIRAGEGQRPVIVFQPGPNRPQLSSMMLVRGDKLQIVNVSFELDLNKNSNGSGLSLFELAESTLDLQDCWLTIINPEAHAYARREASLNPDVRFISVHRPVVPGSFGTFGQAEQPMAIAATAQIRLENCVVRGEGTFVHSDGLATSITWRNGILAISDYMLAGTSSSEPVTPLYSLDVKHLSAGLSGGLAKITTQGSLPADMLLLKTDIADSILIGGTKTILLSQNSPEEIAKQQKRISWLGSGIFYEQIGTYWEVVDTSNFEQPITIGQHDWHNSWPGSSGPMNGGSAYFANPTNQSDLYHQHTISAYVLEDSVDNAARLSSSDGQDAGAIVNDLPDAPSEKLPHPGLSRGNTPQP